MEQSKETSPSVGVGRSDDSASGEPRSIEERLDFLTNMVEKLSKNNAASGEESLDELSREGSVFMEMYGNKNKPEKPKLRHRPLELKSRSDSLENTEESSRAESPSSTDRGATNEANDPVAALNLGHLSLQDGGGRSR